MILIYTTHPDKETAERISQNLIDRKHVACVNYSSIEACLIWKGEKTTENEVVALYKTNSDKWNEVVTSIENQHPYEVPCIIRIDVAANSKYEDWVDKSTV